MDITKKLANDFQSINSLSESDVLCLRRLIIDYFAASFAGYKLNREFNSSVEKAILQESGTEESSVFLLGTKLPATKAAFLNAVYAHGAELDDGNRKSMGHAGVHVISAVFALAEALSSTQEETMIALATGYEAYIRLSSAAQPGMVKRGFHSTGMAGALACAAACARLYHLDAEGIENAVALATTMSCGLLSYGDSRPAIKPLNPAKAAETGIFSAVLANDGVKGPTEALEGPNGWFHAVTDEVHEDMLEASKDGRLLIHDCYFKLYPSCRHTHSGIEAAVNLHSKVNLNDIKRVDVYIYPNAINLAGQIRCPKDQDETKFSIHYTLACALVNGQYGIADMNPSKASQSVVEMINKINLIPDERMENREKGIRGANVKVILNNGGFVEETILVPKGDPEKPLSNEDIEGKLYACAAGQVSKKTIEKLIQYINGMGGNKAFVYPLSFYNEAQ